jgi:glycosyl transferase family 1
MRVDLPRAKRVLVSWYGDPRYIPPFVLPAQQITVGPKTFPDQPKLMYSGWTPLGSYDLKEILQSNHLPVDFDAIVVWADASMTNLPLNLDAFGCPKLLCVGDTHHFDSPLTKMLSYAITAKYDYVISSHNRHHLHWFAEAGFANVAWLPGLKVRHLPRPFQESRSAHLAFVGKAGELHPRRKRFLRELDREGIPLVAVSGPREYSADLYASSLVAFNASLNGDLNLRVFEILSAGGCLLTDRLSSQSGLDAILQEDKDYIGYDSLDECISTARFLLSNPKRAVEIARAGQHAFVARMLPEQRTNEVMDWIFKGQLDRLFRIPKAHHPTAKGISLNDRVRVYENLQGLHRTGETPEVLFWGNIPQIYILDSLDLRRLKLFTGDRVGASALAPDIGGRCRAASTHELQSTLWDCVVVDAAGIVPDFVRHQKVIKISPHRPQ